MAMLYPRGVAEDSKHSITRRRFLQLSGLGAAGLLMYSGEFERHRSGDHISHGRAETPFPGAGWAADRPDFRYPLRAIYGAVVCPACGREVNRLAPDMVVLTGDYVSEGPMPEAFGAKSSYPCAEILSGIMCPQRWCVLGNHDTRVGADDCDGRAENPRPAGTGEQTRPV